MHALEVLALHRIVRPALVGSQHGPLVVTHDHTLLKALPWMNLRTFGFRYPNVGCIALLVDHIALLVGCIGLAWHHGLAGALVKHVVVAVVVDVGVVVSTWRDLRTIGRRIDAYALRFVGLGW